MHNIFLVFFMQIVTCEATANIAVVKYWGKRDEKLVLPQNGSLSFTMDEQLKTRTSVLFDPSLSQDELWLNGQQLSLTEGETLERLQQLSVIRERAGITSKAKIVSLNCFTSIPTFLATNSHVLWMSSTSSTFR